MLHMILHVYNMSVFPHVSSLKNGGPQGIPLDVIEPVSSKKWNFVFGNTQLVSKERDIVNLEVVPDDNPEI